MPPRQHGDRTSSGFSSLTHDLPPPLPAALDCRGIGYSGGGAVAGWLAGMVVKGGGYGLIGDIIVGIIGGFIAGWLLPQLGIVIGAGMVAAIINAFIGAVILLLVLRLVKRAA
jgi:uncharacterized membrane protein YeaQ/YmgE (transglycosylase-associated protein family)